MWPGIGVDSWLGPFSYSWHCPDRPLRLGQLHQLLNHWAVDRSPRSLSGRVQHLSGDLVHPLGGDSLPLLDGQRVR